MIRKKDYITLSVLGGVFLCLLLVFIFAVAPLLKEEDSKREPPEILDGEYTNGVNVSLYKPITDENLLAIKVENSTGEYSFIQQKDDNGKISMVIKDHEKVTYDRAVYAYLSVFAKEPKVPMDGTVIRNVTSAEMAQYGATELLCNAKVTVTYKDGDETKEYKLFIGNKVMSSAQSYYVSVEGRDHVYLINAPFVDNAILKGICDYISPAIYTKYKNASEAGLDINQFIILLTTQSGGDSKEIIMLEQDRQLIGTSTSATFRFTYPEVFPQKIIASNDYVLGVFGQLYISFSGERVVALDPDEATLEKYGLGKNQEQYLVYGTVKEPSDTNYIPAIYISKEFKKEVDGKETYVHYVMSGYHAEVTIVEVPAEQLYFLKNDNQTMLDWAATNSVFAGFSEYLRPEPDIGASGVKVIRIRTKDFNEEFEITISPNGQLTAKSRSGKYEFIDNLSATEAYTTNQFSNLYTLLLYYPMPSRFTKLTGEELQNAKTEENIIYQLDVEMNDGKLYKYTYYTLDEGYSGYALCESIEGKINENGEREYGIPQAIFDVKSRHIGLIAEAYKIIMTGGTIKPMDYIY